MKIEDLITPDLEEKALAAAKREGSAWSHKGQIKGVRAAMLAVLPTILTKAKAEWAKEQAGALRHKRYDYDVR